MGPSTSYLLVPRCKGKRETKKGKDSFCKMGFVLCLLRFELQNISFRITNHIFSRLLTLNKIQFNVKPEDEIEDDMICDERSSCKVERLAMKRFLFHYLASHFLADRNSTTTNKEEKEQEI